MTLQTCSMLWHVGAIVAWKGLQRRGGHVEASVGEATATARRRQHKASAYAALYAKSKRLAKEGFHRP